jgi:hypothetical protein
MLSQGVSIGMTIGVVNFSENRRLETALFAMVFAVLALFLCVLIKAVLNLLYTITYIYEPPSQEKQLLFDWISCVQNVIYTFLMMSFSNWATIIYNDASRPWPGVYLVVFVIILGFTLHSSRYAHISFFSCQPASSLKVYKCDGITTCS